LADIKFLAQIGLVDPEIVSLQGIIKNKKKNLMQTIYSAYGADMPCGLNYRLLFVHNEFRGWDTWQRQQIWPSAVNRRPTTVTCLITLSIHVCVQRNERLGVTQVVELVCTSG